MIKKVLIRHIGLLAFGLLPFASFAQTAQNDTLFNQTDAAGRKQGYWKKTDGEGNLIYKGYFSDNRPSGKFTRYYASGAVKSIMNFLPDKHTVTVRFYYANGKLAATGTYYDQVKDGEWKYYSFYEDFLSYRENYVRGEKEGLSVKYYPDGKVAEELMWQHGSRNGKWKQYYPNGNQKLETSYVNDKLEGPFIIYQLTGDKQIEGTYKNNLREGTWHFYDLTGKITNSYHYHNGISREEEDITQQQTQLLDSLEKYKGTFKEPDLNDPGIIK